MVAALALLVAAPAVLAGQEDAPRARERDRVRVYTWNENRGRIGVVVSTEANTTTDRLGARIEGVTPGTPAERGGIKAGDVITKFNGTALAGAPADASDESGPGQFDWRARLPGDTVRDTGAAPRPGRRRWSPRTWAHVHMRINLACMDMPTSSRI
jgi:hypothetical protein